MSNLMNTEKIRNALQHLVTIGDLPDGFDEDIPYEYNGERLVVVTRQDVIDKLSRYLKGDWAEGDVGSWCREVSSPYRWYLAYEAGYGYIIDDIVSQWETFWEESLTPQNAKEDIVRLQSAKYNPNDGTP